MEKRKSRYRVMADPSGRLDRVEVRYADPTMTPEVWFCRPDGGYVRVKDRDRPNANVVQAMDLELNNGSTLTWDGHSSLVRLVARNLRAYYRRIDRQSY